MAAGSQWALPSVTHLHLRNLRPAPSGEHHIFSRVIFHNIHHLISCTTDDEFAARAGLTLSSLLPGYPSDTDSLILRDSAFALAHGAQAHPADFAHLETLAISTPDHWRMDASVLDLRALPNALRVLDLAARPFATGMGRALAQAWTADARGVRGLEVLRLPAKETLSLRWGGTEAVRKIKGALTGLAQEAEHMGVAVEWV
jgi:hypothetical protein